MVKHSPSDLGATFAALADPTRRAIVSRLTAGHASVTELAQPFDMSLPAISKHLRVLEAAGLLERQREGRTHRIALRPMRLREAMRWLDDTHRFWEQRFDSLAAYLEDTKSEEKPPWQPPNPKSPFSSAAGSRRRATGSSAPGSKRTR